MSSLLPISIFIGSAVVFIASSRRISKDPGVLSPAQPTTDEADHSLHEPKSESVADPAALKSKSIHHPNGHASAIRTSSAWEKYVPPISKEEALGLRQKYFGKNVTLSYSNSGSLMIVGGSGSRLFDETGAAYLDTRNNVAHCGHGHPKVVAAVQQQVAVLNTNTRYLHPNVALLAQRLAKLLPDPLQVVYFCNSGSEANDLALRLARLYSRSKNTIVVDGAYHGHTSAAMEISPYKYEKSSEFELLHPAAGVEFMTPGKHIWKVPSPDTFRGQYKEWSERTGAGYAAFVEEACQYFREKRGEKVAAFIMEGGISVGGVILPPPTYLRRCAKAVRDAGGLYIADEVQTGFGRLGSCFWGFQFCSQTDDNDETAATITDPVVPDVVTVGKAFGNAMPLAAVVTTRQVAQVFEEHGGEYFNTFGGNPVCAAAGLAVLDVIESEHLQQRALEVGEYLKRGFLELQKHLDCIGDVRGSGLFLGIELVKNRKTLEPATLETSFVCTTLKEKYKILTSIDGKHENVIVIKPPMVFSKADSDLFLECFQRVVTEDLNSISDVNEISKTPT